MPRMRMLIIDLQITNRWFNNQAINSTIRFVLLMMSTLDIYLFSHQINSNEIMPLEICFNNFQYDNKLLTIRGMEQITIPVIDVYTNIRCTSDRCLFHFCEYEPKYMQTCKKLHTVIFRWIVSNELVLQKVSHFYIKDSESLTDFYLVVFFFVGSLLYIWHSI